MLHRFCISVQEAMVPSNEDWPIGGERPWHEEEAQMKDETPTLFEIIRSEVKKCVIDEGEIADPDAFGRRVAQRVLDRLEAAQIKVLS
jgi:hypothetical protein